MRYLQCLQNSSGDSSTSLSTAHFGDATLESLRDELLGVAIGGISTVTIGAVSIDIAGRIPWRTRRARESM